ncbi:hypothetical protein V7075_28230 [Neobacillus drentensis]|uniref:hypothetical protein n=1 Tax=Neobacillus drentensis TaxID=220684 RepID=UPI002FFDCEED
MMKQIMAQNSLKRKNNSINRICTPSYYIKEVEKENHSSSYLWNDEVSYQLLENNSMIETNNSLGLLMIRRRALKNLLLNHTYKFLQ